MRFMADGFVMAPGQGEQVSPAMTLKVGDKNSQELNGLVDVRGGGHRAGI
jgi:hypothetical protein